MAAKCPHCGKPLPEEASFCLACFKPVNENAGPGVFVNKIQNDIRAVLKSKRFIYAVASLIVIVAAIAALSLKTADPGGLAEQYNRSDANMSDFGIPAPGGAELPVYEILPGQTDPAAVQPADSTQNTGETGSFLDYLRSRFGAANVAVTDSLPQTNPATGVENAGGIYPANTGTAGYSYTDKGETGVINNGGGLQMTEKNGQSDIQNPLPSQPGGVLYPQELPTQNEIETQKPTETEKPTEVYRAELGLWEYKDYNKAGTQAALTKYNGSAQTVVVPALIDGKKVVSLEKGALSDNNSMKTLRFETENEFPFLWINSGCINNCPNLETIYFPDTDLGVVNNFANGVPKLASVTFANGQWRALDGCIYYYNGANWYLRYVCPGYKGEVLNVPRWCISIESNCGIENNPYIKTVNVHEALQSLWNNWYNPPHLERINVDETNPYLIGSSGAAFQRNSTISWLPPQNRSKELVVPAGCGLYLRNDFVNPYTESIRFAADSKLFQPMLLTRKTCFPALQTVYIEKGSELENVIKADFMGQVIMY